MKCPLGCQTGSIKLYHIKDGYKYLQCAHCNFLFLESIPDNLETIYQSDYFDLSPNKLASGYVNYEQDKQIMNKYYINCLNYVKHALSQHSPTLLDIGTATGHFLELAQENGIKARGIEISRAAVEKAKQLGRSVAYGNLGDLDENFLSTHQHSFDIITIWDTLEHLTHLHKSFQEINQLLKPQGVLVIGTPNAGSLWARFFGKRWHSFVPPEHTLFFNKKNINKFLSNQGYKILKLKTMHKKFTLPYIFNMAYRWLKFKPFSNFSHLLTQNKFLSNLTFKIPIGDNMLVIARKTSQK